ncbi:MAG: uroporphyrinogen-III C-methyltransferase [Candidatus Omnitrophota bacterium]|nr:uroporphyrinogen-III C-methyltransferase [Candidatus Omnitrophota bacterium]
MKQRCSGAIYRTNNSAIYRANKGKVYLTGAGPGDPGLITLKAIECLKKAKVVIYDRLVNPELLKYAPKDAEILYAGKASKKHSLSQDEINRLIVKKAKEGKTVVRLKGGDPFLFGRGAEEALELAKNKIPFEVIPGVSSAIAVPAYAGIPLTHREFTSSVGIFTGHEDPVKKSSRIDWEKISAGLGTQVFLMGVENLSFIVKNLLSHSRPKSTPCCLIQEGTTPRQKTVTANLGTIVLKAKQAKILPPAILVVGEVVSLRKQLNWLENKPLFGKKILITRPKGEDIRFSQILEEYGASCVELPAIAIKPLSDYSQLDAAIKDISGFQWLIFSSRNGVRFFKQRLDVMGQQTGEFISLSFPRKRESRQLDFLNQNLNRLKKIKIAAIGPRTASALESLGLRVHLQPDKFCQEGMLKSFGRLKLKSQNILIINALEARDVLARGLAKMGNRVTTAPVYQTDNACLPARQGRLTLDDKKNSLKDIDIITFTSSLAARNFLKTRFKNTLIASIGPITSRAIRTAGFKVNIEATEYTLEGLGKAIVKYYKNR